MNLKAKLTMLAKAISVWWGIFLIIGCCIGFSVKILLGIFFTAGSAERFDVGVFIPFMLVGSFVLAIISYLISTLVRNAPERQLYRQLDKILDEQGICKDYIDLLCSNCRGDLKNKVYIELALSYLAMNEIELAKSSLDNIDLVSVLDIAQSTGNYYTAAYYYSAVMSIYIQQKDYAAMVEAYESGSFYIDIMSSDSYIMTIKALYLMQTGNPGEALKAIDRVSIIKKKTIKGRFFHGLVLAARAYILYSLNDTYQAEKTALEAMSYKMSPVIIKNLESLVRMQRMKDDDTTGLTEDCPDPQILKEPVNDFE